MTKHALTVFAEIIIYFYKNLEKLNKIDMTFLKVMWLKLTTGIAGSTGLILVWELRVSMLCMPWPKKEPSKTETRVTFNLFSVIIYSHISRPEDMPKEKNFNKWHYCILNLRKILTKKLETKDKTKILRSYISRYIII